MKITIPKILMWTIGLLALAIMWFTSAFAYTPSSDLTNRLSSATNKLETLISIQWESVREQIISILESYKTNYSSNDRAIYIIDYLLEELTLPSEITTTGTDIWTSNFMWSYIIDDAIYGTKTNVTVSGDTRTIESNALPNHETGEFPNSANPNTMSAQDVSYAYDTEGTYVGNETWTRMSGVAINGIKFEPETNERVTCDSGEVYRIEWKQTTFDVMGIDDQNAHVQPTWEYHYHGISYSLVDFGDSGNDVVQVWFAADGFPIYYSKSGEYASSFTLSTEPRTWTSCVYRDEVVIEGTTPDGTYGSDWEYIEWLGDLDACNGVEVNGEYIYFATDEFPYLPRCLNWEIEWWPGGWGWGPGGQWWWPAWGPPPRR